MNSSASRSWTILRCRLKISIRSFFCDAGTSAGLRNLLSASIRSMARNMEFKCDEARAASSTARSASLLARMDSFVAMFHCQSAVPRPTERLSKTMAVVAVSTLFLPIHRLVRTSKPSDRAETGRSSTKASRSSANSKADRYLCFAFFCKHLSTIAASSCDTPLRIREAEGAGCS